MSLGDKQRNVNKFRYDYEISGTLFSSQKFPKLALASPLRETFIEKMMEP